ncbi:DUF308 domain-containing protein [Actinomycetaceae bacterium MB13-C1-2]|nr:DUF308 domain-containing protein [Actinomycetaceae bacterium MB13-C1-2]
MSDSSVVHEAAEKAHTGIRVGVAVFGVLSIVIGALVLTHPAESATSIGLFAAIVLGLYAVVAGIAIGFGAFFTRGLSFWGRALRLIGGILAVIAGGIVLFNPAPSALFVVVFAVIMVGVTWVIEGIVTLLDLQEAPSKGWAIFYAVISIIAGIVLFIAPLTGAAVMLIVIGVSAIVWGVVAIIASIRFSSATI